MYIGNQSMKVMKVVVNLTQIWILDFNKKVGYICIAQNIGKQTNQQQLIPTST